MARVRLTDRLLRSLTTLRAQEDFYDEAFSGGSFLVRVTKHQRRSFYFGYKMGRRNVKLRLGTYPGLSLAEARKEALELVARVARGEDPAKERRQSKKVSSAEARKTFASLAKDYIKRHAIPKKRESSVREDLRIISTYLTPAWGERLLGPVKKGTKTNGLEIPQGEE